MTDRIVPDDIVLKAYSVFRKSSRKTDSAVISAHLDFLAYIENGKLSAAKARKLLSDESSITAFVEEHRQALKAKEAENISRITAASRELSAASRELSVKTIADNLAVSKALLEKTHANSEKTLNGQDAMRSEFKGLIDELHDSVKAVKSATSANETTAKAIATQVTALGTASKDIHAEVKKAVKNTSTVTAVLVGLGVGFLAGLPANYVYERHFSVDAMNRKAEAARRDKDTAGASAPPPPGNDKGESFVALPYSGLADPLTGKNLMDLFNEGNTVRLLKQDGSSICLQMPKPIPCVGAEVPKQQPKAVVPPRTSRKSRGAMPSPPSCKTASPT